MKNCTIVPIFVDTNVLVYARDTSQPTKQPQAGAWVRHLIQTRQGRLSYQVLQEYYVTTTRKLRPGLPVEQARADIRDLLSWAPVAIDDIVLEGAWEIEERFGLSFWDSLIVSAAHSCGCTHLLSEDLQHEADLDGLVVVNPFLTKPPAH